MPHPSFEYVRESGGIREYRLSANGLQVLLMPQAAAPVVTFMVTYRVGSRNERAGLTGATHLLEHLMFKGTERFNK
jgi:zinc protease